MPLPDLEIVRVVRRRHLHHARAERRVHEIVGDDRDLTFGEGEEGLPADQVLVPLVLRVHRYGGIAQHRLRTRGGDDEELLGGRGLPLVQDRVLDVPELAVLFAVVHLVVGDRRVVLRAPVDDVLAAVDQSILVQADEHFAHGSREALVHREALAFPVAGGAEGAELLDDHAAVLLPPFPHPLDELLAAEVVTGLSLLIEGAFDDVLRGDAGMVGAGDPAGFVAGHPLEADEGILQGIVQDVPHVQHAGHIGGRDDDRVGLL